MTAMLHHVRRASVDRQFVAFILVAAGTGVLIGLTVALVPLADSRGLIALGTAMVGGIVALHGRWLMSTAVFLMFVSPTLLPPLAEVQGFTIRIIDAVAVLLAAHGIVRILRRVEGPVLTASGGRIFGLSAVFLAYVGVTLVIPLQWFPDHFPVAAISFARLVSSFALGIIIYPLLDRAENLARIRKIIIAAAFTNGLIATAQWIQMGVGSLFHPSMRVGGLLGPDGLGLAGGLLLVLSLPGQGRWADRWQRRAGGIGVLLGLLMLLVSKSASAILAAGAGASLLLFLNRRPRMARKQLIVAAVILAVGLAAVVGLRWYDVVGLFEVSGGSFTQRLIVGYSAWLIFLEHPLLGVGWQTSWAPGVIGDPAVSAQVRQRLGELPQVLLPEQSPTSVHNLYLQVLAELGLVGAVLFVAMVVQITRECRRLLRRSSPVTRRVAVHWTVILVMLGIWLNTNPLFGGQMAAYLLFLAFAVISAAPRLDRGLVTPAAALRAQEPGSLEDVDNG